MKNMASILEIRKFNFIKNPNYENYVKLVTKIDKHKEIFDNKFFAEVTKNTLQKKDIKGLLYISQLYIELNRNIEAEFILSRAHKIDETNNEVLYYLFDILCRRKQLGLVSVIGKKLDESKDELMFAKSMIKYLLLTKKENELNNYVKSNFDKFKVDKEFVWLVFIAGIQNNNEHFTYLVSKTNYQRKLFNSLSKPIENRIKNHFLRMIVNLLRKKINDN